jgi:phospholipid/cholesterol/gamma-HCH transport system substrate-binding protein
MASSRLVIVGLFVVGGVVLFAAGLFLIGDRRGLFAQNFEVFAEFSELAGLENGAVARVAGMDAGEVVQIQVPPSPTAKFRVRIRVREELHGVVRTDSVASIQNEGLVGNKFLQIEGGSDKAPRAPHGSTIRSRDPFDIADMLQQMSETLTLVTDTVDMLRVEIQTAIRTISDAAGETRDMITAARDDVESIVADGRRITADMRSVMDDVASGRGTIGKLITDDALYQKARDIAGEAERVVANLREATVEAKEAIGEFRGRSGDATQGIAAELRQTLAHARDAMAGLAESADALKRNFFLRGYFNRRGYFDLSEIGVDAYRDGALERDGRRALRIWLDADRLFTSSPDGTEKLTVAGRAQVDAAMSEFLGYPPASPIVIEGYAAGATDAERYVRSRDRAAEVREYVLGHYKLDANRVGLMPLGSQADSSPTGGTWNGVAIAIFVPRQ